MLKTPRQKSSPSLNMISKPYSFEGCIFSMMCLQDMKFATYVEICVVASSGKI